MKGDDLILVADLGGTHSRVALGDRAGRLHRLRKVRNAAGGDPLALLQTALAGEESVSAAVIAAAGPLQGDAIQLTNQPTVVSRGQLQARLGIRRVVLVNDFVAVAHAVGALDGEHLRCIQEGAAGPEGNLLVCGPGTGFGAAALVHDGGRRAVLASEAGHALLGAADEGELEILRRVRGGSGPLCVEDVLSGRGLRAIYEIVSGRPAETDRIILSAQANEDAAGQAVSLFMGVFGRIAGDLALIFNAFGGIYLAGGLGRALALFYEGSPFLSALYDHAPYEDRMRRVPVRLITHPEPGLVGALQIGLRQP